MVDDDTAAGAAGSPVAVMLGLAGLVVLAAGEVGGEVELLVETDAAVTGCPGCGVLAVAHGRREHLVRDTPCGGRPVLLVWRKRIWRCPEPACPRRTWSETHPQIAAKAALTERARAWAARRVGRDRHPVEQVRRELGVGWHTVMRAVRAYGRPLVDDPGRLTGVDAIGVDEHVFLTATASRRTSFVTGIVDVRTGRLLDLVEGRDGAAVATWLAARPRPWRDGIGVCALDPLRAYRAGLRAGFADRAERALPAPTLVLDHFHAIALANDTVDLVRRRVQRAATGRRGTRNDPLYRYRRRLLRGAERLTADQLHQMTAALTTIDPSGQLARTWATKEHLRRIYRTARTETDAAHMIDTLITSCRHDTIPELATLGRTLHAWRPELLAYFSTGGVSNGPTETANMLIEKTRRTAHGYRNFDNYRLRLLLAHGVTWQTPLTPRIRPRRPRIVA